MGVQSQADRCDDRRAAAGARAREFVSAVRALDRMLISGFYVVPLFHLPDQWVARWTQIEHPPATRRFSAICRKPMVE